MAPLIAVKNVAIIERIKAVTIQQLQHKFPDFSLLVVMFNPFMNTDCKTKIAQQRVWI